MKLGRAAKVEFGDYQTPQRLAEAACDLIASRGERPAAVVEPTCGAGSFLAAAGRLFPEAILYGRDCNAAHVECARQRLRKHPRTDVQVADFFSHDWRGELARLPDPLLILGNPPWVTNAAIGALGGNNLPHKSNADKLRGIQAITGSANFDISEWMIRQNLGWLEGRTGTVAVLCKTSVARKVLLRAWSSRASIASAAIHLFDAAEAFGVSVDAGLLLVRLAADGKSDFCTIYDDLDGGTANASMAYREGRLVANATAFDRVSSLRTDGFSGWRSGLTAC